MFLPFKHLKKFVSAKTKISFPKMNENGSKPQKNIKNKNIWHKIACKSQDLHLKATLSGGQSFRWKVNNSDGDIWEGVFNEKFWRLKQSKDCLEYQVFDQNPLPQDSYMDMLRDYFHLDVNIEEHYKLWSKADPIFDACAKEFQGIRLLKQEIVENIFSFICSSNNNISRIAMMVEKLSQLYGTKIGEFNGTIYFGFPKVKDLLDPSLESVLKLNGFGYRAKYIAKSALTIAENGGQSWIDELKTKNYEEAKTELMKLTGIGAKVADCICLMSLGHLGAIPVDTHVYQIAQRHYLPHLAKRKTVTDKIYKEIGDHFRSLYGDMAGWAHTVLFCADLKKFQTQEEEKHD